MGFWDYLVLHYFNSSHYDADHARNMQLPFKNMHVVSVLIALQPPCEEVLYFLIPLEDFTERGCLPPVKGCLRPPYMQLPAQPPEA